MTATNAPLHTRISPADACTCGDACPWACQEIPRPEDIKPDEIQQWLDSKADVWSPATRNRYLALMKLAYRLAERSGSIKANPLRLVRARKENNERVRYLSDAGERALRITIAKSYSEHLPEFEVALMTGMRQGEQFGLTWDRVDLDNATLRLNKTKNGKPRFVTLNTRALTVMKALREFNLEGHGSAQRVFIRGQEPYWFPCAITEAKIVDFRWHDLRHTFASRLVMAGVDIRTVQELLGHESITMTMRYAHLSPQHRATALEKLCQPTATTTATSEKTDSQPVAPTIQ